MKNLAPDLLRTNRSFRSLWIGDTVGQFSFFISNTTVPLFAVISLSSTPLQLGMLTAAETAAYLAVGLPAGVWVDRARKRSIMISSDIVRAVLLLSIPLTWWCGVLSFLQLALTIFVVGIGTVFFDIAYQSYLPALVDRAQLAEGNSKLQASQSAGQALGPGLGGLAARIFGAGNAVLLSGFGYLFSAYSLTRIRTCESREASPVKKELWAEVREGLRFIFRDRVIRPIALCSATASFFNSAVLATEVLFLSSGLKLSELGVGIALGLSGLGSVLGALTARRWMAKVGSVRAIWLVPLIFWPLHILFPLARPGWSTALGVLGAAAFCYGTLVYNVASVTVRQQICPNPMLGRMNASLRFLVWGVMPVGAVCGGLLAEWQGVRFALLLGTLGVLLGILWLLFSPLKKIRDLSESA